MAIEPTSLGDLMTMPDVALDLGNRASGQDFAEFSDVLALCGLTVVGVSTVDVGNPTPEAVVIDAPVAVDPQAEQTPKICGRSEQRRVGKVGVRPCRCRGGQEH